MVNGKDTWESGGMAAEGGKGFQAVTGSESHQQFGQDDARVTSTGRGYTEGMDHLGKACPVGRKPEGASHSQQTGERLRRTRPGSDG